tara:strand:+ start:660 stop:836 length:177 start_codon:yes stop_codon:yes gene_type:complete
MFDRDPKIGIGWYISMGHDVSLFRPVTELLQEKFNEAGYKVAFRTRTASQACPSTGSA